MGRLDNTWEQLRSVPGDFGRGSIIMLTKARDMAADIIKTDMDRTIKRRAVLIGGVMCLFIGAAGLLDIGTETATDDRPQSASLNGETEPQDNNEVPYLLLSAAGLGLVIGCAVDIKRDPNSLKMSDTPPKR